MTRPLLDADHPVFILAMDHRDSLAKHTYGIESGVATDPVDVQHIAAGKQLVYRGLLDALSRGASRANTGVLVDERYGAEVARSAKDAGLQLAMPIEASGHEWFELEYGDDWREHVEAFDPDYVKVLVRDNPALDPERREQQAERLAGVSAAVAETGRRFLVELLVPATAEQAADGQAGPDYDRDVRPDLTVQVIEYLQDFGVEPDVWKIEGLDARVDSERIVATVQRQGRDGVQCIILGRDAPESALDHWLQVAAPVPGFVGFAIGRSVWEQPLGDVVSGELDSEDAEDLIAVNYRRFVDAYVDAEPTA
jgi:myo-inositol catabolism protein IolC